MNLRILSNVLVGYMLLAFTWWAVHLWRENERLYKVEGALIFSSHQQATSKSELRQLPEFQAIEQRYRARKLMIVTEGTFFTGCLILGLWIMRRSAAKEVALARQRRNFLLSITHELKSPIAGMQLVFETFARRELNREQAQHLAANGLRDAARLHTLVQDLLLAARLEDRWKPLIEPLNLAKIAGDSIASLRIRFPEANLQVDLPSDFPPVQADQSGLTSVVHNLLENAVKYSPAGSPVRLSAEGLPSGKTRIQVRDEGQGIPQEERKTVFEKFHRLGNEETRQATGTGLGLYIVQQVVLAHGGQISISDNTPHGTVFTVEI